MNEITSLNNGSPMYLDQTKYQLSEVFNRQKTSNEVQLLVKKFHIQLSNKEYIKKNSQFKARTHKKGITYMINDKKAFLMIDIHQKFFSGRFFTGNAEIPGQEKGNWLHSKDDAGCKMFRIVDNNTLEKALDFAYVAYGIAHS